MKEKLINLFRKATYYPRKIIDLIIYKLILNKTNNWFLLNQFKKKPVLIVGNGPSLKKTPLHSINAVSIGMNKINLLYPQTKWRPDLIVCTNGLVLKQNKDFFNKTNTLLLVPVKAYYLGIKNRQNVIFFLTKDTFKMSANIENYIASGCTVTFLALQIAAYLNPEKVHIVGVDHSFVYKGKEQEIKKMEGDDENHFSKDYFKGQYWGIPNLEESELLYRLSLDYFNKIKVEIKDYTVDGKLDIFPKGNIKDIVSE